jgi:tetratricopeptide (TPR) repeat protein
MFLAAGLVVSGCAARPTGNRFIAKPRPGFVEVSERPMTVGVLPSREALKRAEAAARATRAPRPVPLTVESLNPELHAALLALQTDSTAAAYVRVGYAYKAAGVLDRALDHFDEAIQKDGRLAAAYDGRARIWRDWHLASVGIGDAARAVYYAPTSAAAQNTLGTLLYALGDCHSARRAFARALVLNPQAFYARTNLDYLDHQLSARATACKPGSTRSDAR